MSCPFDRLSLKLLHREWHWRGGGCFRRRSCIPICTVDTHVHSCPDTSPPPSPSLTKPCAHLHLHITLRPDLLGNSHFPNSVQVLGLQISAYNLFLNLPVQRYFPNCSQKATVVLNRACKSGLRGDKQTLKARVLADGWCWCCSACALPAFLSGTYN